MSSISTITTRVEKFLIKQIKKPGWDFASAPDPRKEKIVTHKIQSILLSLELGLVSNLTTLRDVEAMTYDLAPRFRKLIPKPISDTTLDTELRRLSPGYLLSMLILQVRDMHRSKMFKPEGLGIGVVTVDGKNLASLAHDADGSGHQRSNETSKWDKRTEKEIKSGKPYYLMPALRATLISAKAKPCIYQLALPVGTGESSSCRAMVDGLHKAYGRSNLFEVLDFDAGLTSWHTAEHINDLGYGYVFGLKGNQHELFTQAQRLFTIKAIEEQPEAQTPWELRNATRIRRSLWRTHEMRGFDNSVGNWSHLRQTWLVRQETKSADEKIEVEDRYFISSLPWNRLKPNQILALVRGHWGVENDTFNSLDVQWREDYAPWCTKGNAIWSLGILRLMAYNIVQYLRKRSLVHKIDTGSRQSLISWRLLFKNITKVLQADTFTQLGAIVTC